MIIVSLNEDLVLDIYGKNRSKYDHMTREQQSSKQTKREMERRKRPEKYEA